jgi:hypothetical protein
MTIRSLGYRTEIFFPRFDGFVVRKPGYHVIESPNCPEDPWGNFLLFDSPPSDVDPGAWPELFRREFGERPEVRTLCMGWDSPEGFVGAPEAITGFVHSGFTIDSRNVYAAEIARLKRARQGRQAVEVRELEGDADWRALLAHRRPPHGPVPKHRMARYRRICEAGLGRWMGAFSGRKLVADLGVFHDPNDDWATAVAWACDPPAILTRLLLEGLDGMPSRRLVIVAPTHAPTDPILESIGLKAIERRVGLIREPRRMAEIVPSPVLTTKNSLVDSFSLTR